VTAIPAEAGRKRWFDLARLPRDPTDLDRAASYAAEAWAHLEAVAADGPKRHARIAAAAFADAFTVLGWTPEQIDHALDTGAAREHLAPLLRQAGIDPASIVPAGSPGAKQALARVAAAAAACATLGVPLAQVEGEARIAWERVAARPTRPRGTLQPAPAVGHIEVWAGEP
jgi:hypothetical protein